jgi:hypothetical protein
MTAVAFNILFAGSYLTMTLTGVTDDMSAFMRWLMPFCTGIHATLAIIHVAVWLRDRREAAE